MPFVRIYRIYADGDICFKLCGKKLYHSSSVLAVQQLVDDWIISQSVAGGGPAAPQVQVRMAEFPHSTYEENGFWGQVSHGLMLQYSCV